MLPGSIFPDIKNSPAGERQMPQGNFPPLGTFGTQQQRHSARYVHAMPAGSNQFVRSVLSCLACFLKDEPIE
jgi:hypothetical protein